MGKQVARLRGIGFILWHGRHEFYHVLLGLVWAWVLREYWQEYNSQWVAVAIFGSLLPDVDHFMYFFTYGRRDRYTRQILAFLRKRQWRMLTVFVEKGHKNNTDLVTHNYYVIVGLLISALLLAYFDMKNGVVLFGAMVVHYVFDILDDILMLGHVNPNWRRFGKPGRRERMRSDIMA
ncbi:hypothetical protein A2363_01115 [Candidatus Gottesmanbacteria bacterium RIFOXYB1_FULL_47_11]|uniref:Uncharacterized protein n=1 Tax=Candidatus Gottesmanbacteria bacterium RIFOXYB1_FULL_47_11 TaxID=1798401 RepID=A0A1F6BDQ2_9BACT|nr:MAG: hypothetical protein A2363_01115 [Candidatus Gottesmanbacteria bacterium RIFOXYB1_FULL_47_11]